MTVVQSDNVPAAFDSHRVSMKVDPNGEGALQFTLRDISLAELAGRTVIVQGHGGDTIDQDPALVGSPAG